MPRTGRRTHNPTLNAIVTLNPQALDDAVQLDAGSRAAKILGRCAG